MATDPTALDQLAARRVLEKRGLGQSSATLGQSLVTSLDGNPDQVAAARALARRSGLTLPVAEQDPVRAEREARLREIDLPTLGSRSPATAKVLEDPEIARVAHDDVENMGFLERYARDIGQRFQRGQRVNELGGLGFDALIGGDDEAREYRIRQLHQADQNETDFDVESGGAAQSLMGIPGAVAEALPMMGSSIVSSVEGGAAGAVGGGAVGAVAGAPAGPAGALAGAGAGAVAGFGTGSALGLYVSSAKLEAGHSFLELRQTTDESEQPIDPNVARLLSVGVGTVAGGVEMWGLGKLFAKIPGARSLTGAGMREATAQALKNPGFRQVMGGLAGSMTESAFTEGATEGLQELIAIGGELAAGATTGKGLEDFSFEAPNPDGGAPIVLRGTEAILARVASAAAQGAQMGAGVAGAGRATSLLTDSERARRTLAKLPTIGLLHKTSEESKLRERDPEAFKRHAREVATQAGVENVYVDAEAMREYFESAAPTEVQALYEEIPSLRERQEDVARTGADVVIKLEDWLAHPELAEALGDSARFDPLDMTGKEALGFEEDLEREVGSVQELVGASRDADQARATMGREIKAQLLKVYPDTVVAPLVELTLDRIETRAQRLGITAQELVEREGLFKIQGPQDAAPERTGELPTSLEETLGGLRDANRVREVLRDLRADRKPEQKGMSKRPLLEALRDLGGVDPTGDLATTLRELGIPEKGKGSIKGLYREGGMGAGDNLVGDETEIFTGLVDPETGYVDPRLLERALSNEVAGKPLRTQAEGEAIAGAEAERTLIREAMEAAGLTLEADDDAIVGAVSGRTFEQPITDDQVSAEIEALESRHKELERVRVRLRGADIVLEDLVVPKGQRKQGVGSAFMGDLVEMADRLGKRVVLTTGVRDDATGTTSASRLKKFYKRFGFVENKGKDFTVSENMLRAPKSREFREENRGAIRMTEDLAEVVIRFTEAADLSTFLHESGHLYLAQLAKDAAEAGGQLSEDLAAVLEWAGSADVFSTEVQEKFARAFEAYLMEGKAPSLKLDRVFARFQAWLVRIYKRLRGIPGYQGDLTPAIREVMDRLIATEEQIAEAAEARGLIALDAKALGMTEEQAAKYQAQVAEGLGEAKRSLQTQLMAQLERRKSKDWQELREGVRAEVEAEVNARPVFQAAHWLAKGEPIEGQPIPMLPPGKLDAGELVKLYGKEIKKALPKNLWAKEGYHPDQVAEVFGFQDGDDLVRSLQAAGKRLEVIERETDERMTQRHGTLQTSAQIEDAAVEALANAKQIRALQTAERAIAAKAGGKVIPLNVTRAAAQRIVRATRYRDLEPHRYRAAALKASRNVVKMIAKGEFPEAQTAIRHQITNLVMEAEARKAITEADRAVDYLNRVQEPKSWARIGKAGADYQEQIEGLLARFDLRQHQSLRRIDKMHGLAAWIAEQEATGETVLVPTKLRDEAFRQSWKELSIEDLAGLRDSVKSLEHLARRKNEFLGNRERRQREAVQADLIAAADANGKHRPPSLDLTKGEAETWKSWIHSAEGALVKMEFLVDLLDGGAPDGPWRANVFTPIAEAQAERLDLSKTYTEQLARLMDGLIGGQTKAFNAKWFEPRLGVRMNRMNLLALALNVGNEGNLARMTDARGNGWSLAAIQGVLDQQMTAADWAFVRETWTLIDSLWPRIAEQERRLTGIVPEKVQGRTVSTPFGDFQGGYFPVVYDPDRSQLAYKMADKGLYEGLENHFQRAITGHGHTIERTNVAGPLLLDLAVIPSHLDQVIHDLTHREVLMQVDKLLQAKEIRSAFQRTTFGDEWFQLFRPWLQGIAKDRIVENRALSGISKLLSKVRAVSTSFTLGFRETTLLLQTTGHSNAIGILRQRLPNWQRHYANGVRKASGGLSPKQAHATYQGVLEASGEMRHRIGNLDRDLRDVIRRNQGKATWTAATTRTAMELIGKVQLFSVDLPVWLTAYDGAQLDLDMTHDQAVVFADSVVRMSQGAAGAKDLSAFQRADEGYKQFALFFSYMNTVYNQVALFAGRRTRSVKDVPGFLASHAYFVMIPAVSAALIRQMRGSETLPTEDDDDAGDWFAWFVGLGLSETAAMLPFVRDVLPNLIKLATGGGRYFTGETPIQRGGEVVADLVVPKDMTDFVFDGLRVTALARGLPADRILKLTEEQIRDGD